MAERIYALEGFDESDIDADGDSRTVAWDHEEQVLRVESRESGGTVTRYYRLVEVERNWVDVPGRAW